MRITDWGLPAALGAGACALIAWNIALGSLLSSRVETGRVFRVLSGATAFLFLPAVLIGVLAPGTRVLAPLAWLWPLAAVAALVQAIWSLVQFRAHRTVVASIALFDLLAAWVAVVRWVEWSGGMLPGWALIPGIAVSSLVATAAGDAAFPWGAAVLVPLLAPAAPARSRLARAVRLVMSAACALAVGLAAAFVPRAMTRARAVSALDARAAATVARGDVGIGLRLFGTLSGMPSGALARHDVALADSLGVTALHVEFAADGATSAALDSVSRSIAPRRDSLLLVVTLDLDDVGRMKNDAARRIRMATLERIERRLRPDVLAPAEEVRDNADAAWWKAYYVEATRTVRRVNRDVTVALGTDARSPLDSALADWVMTGQGPVDGLMLSVRDYGVRPTRYVAALDAVTRWVALARTPPSVWIAGVPASPIVTGDAAKDRLLRYALAWGAAHVWVRGMIVGDASDGLAANGMRTAAGRAHAALASLGASLRTQRDLAPSLTATDSISPDTAGTAARRPLSDSLIRPPL